MKFSLQFQEWGVHVHPPPLLDLISSLTSVSLIIHILTVCVLWHKFTWLTGTFAVQHCAVQHCAVHTDHTSYILVECTFAINSTAPGFVLIQDEHSQYTINTTLQRHEGDVSKGSVNVTDLPTGEYRVAVYDWDEGLYTWMRTSFLHM